MVMLLKIILLWNMDVFSKIRFIFATRNLVNFSNIPALIMTLFWYPQTLQHADDKINPFLAINMIEQEDIGLNCFESVAARYGL